MGLNNQMYKLYSDMVKGYKDNNIDVIEQCTRCWMQVAPENPFKYDTSEYEEFFQIHRCYTIWTRGDIDQKINRRRMIEHAKQLCALNVPNPYKFDKKEEERDIEEKKKKAEEEQKAHAFAMQREQEDKKEKESLNDFQFVLLNMAKAYNNNNETLFKEYMIHLMDMNVENPFAENTKEYELYGELADSYQKHNYRRVYVVAKELCEVINNTNVQEIKKVKLKTPKLVLGVPEEEEKKSWFRFLHPWKKEGE